MVQVLDDVLLQGHVESLFSLNRIRTTTEGKPIIWILKPIIWPDSWLEDARRQNRPPASADDGIHGIGIRHSLFLNNFEQWMDEIISQDGLVDKELIKTIKERFERSIPANIDHHKFMMNNAKENHDQTTADRHRLMADVYPALLNV